MIAVLTVAGTGVGLAQGWGGRPMRGQGYNQGAGGYGPGSMLGIDRYTSQIQALAEVTGQSEATITGKLQNKPVWAVLDEYKVPYATFQARFHDKLKVQINAAVSDGKITQAQADAMIQRMDQRSGGVGYGGRGRGRGRGAGCPFGAGYGANSSQN